MDCIRVHSNEPIPASGAQFYMLECVSLSKVELTGEAPVCGTAVKATGEDGFPDTFASATVPKDAPYEIMKYTKGSPCSIFAEGEGTSMDSLKPFYGTIKGDTEYKVVVGLMPAVGYVFNKNIDKSNILFNGEAALLSRLDDEDGMLTVVGTVKAYHEWDKGKVTKKPTLKATGIRTFTCLHCDETKTASIAKLKANTMKVSGKTAKVKYSKLKKKSQTLAVSKVIKFSKKGQGTKAYKKVKGNKKITINKKNGKVTVKKGLKKGTYKVKVKVKAAGNATYGASAWKTVTITIKVK